jgi:hypothetical protein
LCAIGVHETSAAGIGLGLREADQRAAMDSAAKAAMACSTTGWCSLPNQPPKTSTAVNARLPLKLLLKGAEEAIPNGKDAQIVFVEVDVVLGVVNAVVGGGLNRAVEKSHAADVAGVRPELVEQSRVGSVSYPKMLSA